MKAIPGSLILWLSVLCCLQIAVAAEGGGLNASLLKRIVTDYPDTVWLEGSRIVLHERYGRTPFNAPQVQLMPHDEEAWLLHNAPRGLQWDGQRIYAITPKGVTAWDRTTGESAWNWPDARSGGGAPSVVVGEGRVLLDDPQGVVHCLDAATGQRLWNFTLETIEANAVERSANARTGQTGCRPLAITPESVYLTTMGGAARNYRIVVLETKTGRFVQQAQPQDDDDLNYSLTNLSVLPNGSGSMAAQEEVSVGRDFTELLALDNSFKPTWHRRVDNYTHVSNEWVCVVGGSQPDGVDPENMAATENRSRPRMLIGIDSTGHEQWKHPLGLYGSVSRWKGIVLASYAENDKRTPTVRRHWRLSGIRPRDGKVLWTIVPRLRGD